MQIKRVIVLGGSGFVGRHLATRLLDDDHQVVVPGRTPMQGRRALPDAVQGVVGDIGDPGFLRELFTDADVVVNLVGILNEQGDDGSGFERVFVANVEAMVDAMRDAGVSRLLQMSALHAGTGSSHYSLARGRGEAIVRGSDRDWTIFRPSVIAGPGDGLFCRFDALLRWTPMLPIGRADARFAPVYVGDVVDAFARAINDPATVGQTYDLVGPDVVTLAGIIELVAQARGIRRLVLPLPDAFGRLQAEVGEHLPGKPISRDNWRALQVDSTSANNGLPRLGITPTPVLGRVPEFIGARIG